MKGKASDTESLKPDSEKMLKEDLQFIARSVNIGLWEYRVATQEVIWDESMYNLYGMTPGSFSGSYAAWEANVYEPDLIRLRKEVDAALTGDKGLNTDFRIKWADNSVHHIKVNAKVEKNAAGIAVRMFGVNLDITEQKNIELERKKTLEFLERTNEAARIGAWEFNIEKNKVYWTKTTRQIHEVNDSYQPDLTNAIAFFEEGENRDKINCAVNAAIHEGKSYDLELQILTGKRNRLWTRAIGNAEMVNGKCVRLYGTFQDIDQQHRIKEELSISEKQFRGAFEYSAIGMALVSTMGKWLKVNKCVCDILGYTEQELLQLDFQKLTYAEDLEIDLNYVNSMLEGSLKSYQMEKRYLHKNGNIVWVLLSVSLVKDNSGKPLHFVAQLEDITQRKNIEAALLKVNEELRAIFNSENSVAIIATDLQGTITQFSRGAEVLLGYSATEVIGKSTPALFHSLQEVEERGIELTEELGRIIKGFDVFIEFARQGKYESREWTYIRKDRSFFPVQLAVTAIKNLAGEISGYVGIATDVTERKQAEENARHYAQLEAKNTEMEQFTYIASHDLQEPLRTVSSFAALLTRDYENKLDENGKQYLHYISQSTGRMTELIKGLLFYARIGRERKLEVIDCNKLLAAVKEDLHSSISAANAVVSVSDLPVIEGYKMELTVLFQNLIGNALKFRKKEINPIVNISAKKTNGLWTFKVSDNGIGIERKNKDKIFILFQRLHNKKDYAGTGIGLAHCKKIVELHNGNIWIESIPGEGTDFYFTLSSATV